MAVTLLHFDSQRERRQITLVSCDVRVYARGESTPDIEQLIDIATKFGGHRIGSAEDEQMVCFGYPYVSDNDARRAARTALEWHTSMHLYNEIGPSYPFTCT